MYKLEAENSFVRRYQKLAKNNSKLAKRIDKALKDLSKDPMRPSLRSHKVRHSLLGYVWSSWVTGDVRIIWKYKENHKLVIMLLSIGGHAEVYI